MSGQHFFTTQISFARIILHEKSAKRRKRIIYSSLINPRFSFSHMIFPYNYHDPRNLSAHSPLNTFPFPYVCRSTFLSPHKMLWWIQQKSTNICYLNVQIPASLYLTTVSHLTNITTYHFFSPPKSEFTPFLPAQISFTKQPHRHRV